ncbi:hypothetical protein EVAR_93770_1 [Eumeta japonica]|uniref:Uncharacterized protein n=1 Tax=Eumeta variegata TaxID=151549 RepID=A0A4C1VBS3_EUMVA|nr:hypothetical protein EVAR_93770_1 [Eumeta japonica]
MVPHENPRAITTPVTVPGYDLKKRSGCLLYGLYLNPFLGSHGKLIRGDVDDPANWRWQGRSPKPLQALRGFNSDGT